MLIHLEHPIPKSITSAKSGFFASYLKVVISKIKLIFDYASLKCGELDIMRIENLEKPEVCAFVRSKNIVPLENSENSSLTSRSTRTPTHPSTILTEKILTTGFRKRLFK